MKFGRGVMKWTMVPVGTGLGKRLLCVAGLVGFFLLWAQAGWTAEEVVIYSARNEPFIKPLLDTYTQESGVAVKFITDKEGPLLARLGAEGARTPADILMTVDAGTLWLAASKGLFRSVDSPLLRNNIPAHLRDAENRWFGLSMRVRTIVYNTKKVKPEELSSYEALGDPQWKGRLCLRTSKKVYNQSLVAMMIAALGEGKTEQTVRGWVRNLAVPVFSDDVQVMKAIAAGQCDVGIVNSYYYGRLKAKSPNLPLALFWPNQKDRGVHVNISGAGLTRYSKHPEAALRLLEWLASDKAQEMVARLDFEYPVNPKISPSPSVVAWGHFKQDPTPVFQAGALQPSAVRLMDRAGYK